MSLNENKSIYITETLCMCIMFYLAFDIPPRVFLYLSFVHLFFISFTFEKYLVYLNFFSSSP